MSAIEPVWLQTPPLPLLVAPETFDDFGWCPSDVLAWRCPTPSLTLNDLDDALPLGMAFVFHAPWEALPAELAWLHVGRRNADALGLGESMALAPYALDDATDAFHAHRRRPRDTLWLVTDNANALYWSLHDWSHFHNHGSFDDRPSTELQCDAAALYWLWINRARAGVPDAHWERLRVGALENHLRLREIDPVHRAPEPTVLTSLDALLRAVEG